MKALILAGGFGTRLYPLTKDKPKPLLPVAGKPVIEYLLEKIVDIKVREIIVSTNLTFKENFEKYFSQTWLTNIKLAVEESRFESEKLGAIRAIANLTSYIDDDCLIAAGDNIFTSSLKGLVWKFNHSHVPVVGLYYLESLELVKRYSSATLGSEGKILTFYEKPKEPQSKLIGTCLYMFPKKTLNRVVEYVKRGIDHDAPGKFIEWLCKKENVYGYVLNGIWYDIGSMDTYQEANRYFSTLTTNRNGRLINNHSI